MSFLYVEQLFIRNSNLVCMYTIINNAIMNMMIVTKIPIISIGTKLCLKLRVNKEAVIAPETVSKYIIGKRYFSIINLR